GYACNRTMKQLAALVLVLCSCATVQTPPPTAPAAPASVPAPAPAPETFLPLKWDDANGKLMMTIPRLGEEMIYVSSLPGGVGSNPIGLDRNGINETRIVRFDRIGPRVLMVVPNYRLRALRNNADEQKAVEDSFAQSVLWSFKVEKSDER